MRMRWRRVASFGIPCLLTLGVAAWWVPQIPHGSSPAPQHTPVREGELELLSVPRSIQALSWSPDGKALAVVTKPELPEKTREQEHAVQIWDVAAGKLQRTLVETADPILAARFAPDGKTVAVGVWRITGLNGGSNQSEVELWETETGRLRGKLAGASSDILALAFSRDGRFLAAGGKVTSGPPVTGRHLSGEVIVWDVAARKVLWQQSRGHTDCVQAVAFSPDGTTLASAGDDKMIRLWDTTSGKLSATWFGHGKPTVSSLAFSPDGARLVSGGADATVHSWDAESGQIERLLTASYAVGPMLRVDMSPDGGLIAAAGTANDGGPERKGRVVLWDSSTGAERHRLADEITFIRDLAYSPNGTTLAIGTAEGKVYLWKLRGQGQDQ